MLTTRTARWTAATGLVCVLILVATWFVLVGPRRSDAAALEEQRLSAEATNVGLRSQIRTLTEQYGDLPAKRAELKEIRAQLPATANVSAVVRSISDYAEQAGVELTGITPGVPTTLQAAAGTTPGIVSTQVTITATGRYTENALFVRYLQNMKRRYLVTDVETSRSDTATSGTTQPSATASPSTTVGSSPSPTITETPTPTPTVTSSAAPTIPSISSGEYSLKITGAVYSLVESTPEGVTGAGAGAGVATAPTATPSAGPTTSPTAAP